MKRASLEILSKSNKKQGDKNKTETNMALDGDAPKSARQRLVNWKGQ